MTTYFEDIEVGEVREFGQYDVTREEIMEFAEQYDPQPFHVDRKAAEESMFGGLVASGWHTASICMRILVENYLDTETSMGARGVDELRWHEPVRPGDTLSVRTEVIEKRPSGDPRRGHVNTRVEGVNGDGETVISYVALGMVARRDPGADESE